MRSSEKHWAVTVSLDGEEILTIESNCLCGKSDLSDEEMAVIRNAAQHLLAFVGEPNEDGWPDIDYDHDLHCDQCSKPQWHDGSGLCSWRACCETGSCDGRQIRSEKGVYGP